MTSVNLTAIALASALTAALFVGPAFAADKTVTVTVGYTDLDLARPEGLATLKQRIRAAATAACHASGTAPARLSACIRQAEQAALTNAAPLIAAEHVLEIAAN